MKSKELPRRSHNKESGRAAAVATTHDSPDPASFRTGYCPCRTTHMWSWTYHRLCPVWVFGERVNDPSITMSSLSLCFVLRVSTHFLCSPFGDRSVGPSSKTRRGTPPVPHRHPLRARRSGVGRTTVSPKVRNRSGRVWTGTRTQTHTHTLAEEPRPTPTSTHRHRSGTLTLRPRTSLGHGGEGRIDVPSVRPDGCGTSGSVF